MTCVRPGGVVLLERQAELAVVSARLDAAAEGEGGVVLVEGPAGIGKTGLLDAARAAAADRGLQVLAARASPLEREFGFGVVRDLLTPVLRDRTRRVDLMQGAARLAGPALELDGPATPTFGALHGIYWLVAGIAERGPLLLAVDDAQWSDIASLRTLLHLAHRIVELPVLLAVTARPTEPDGDAGHLLEILATEPATTLLRPGPLTATATTRWLRGAYDGAVDARFAAACFEVSEGNPLLLTALTRSLRAADVAPDADGTGAVRERAPAIVRGFVVPQLQRLTQQAASVAAALAVLGPGAQLRHLAAVAGSDPVATARAVDALVACELVTRRPRLDFVHPLVARAVVDHIPTAERLQAHRTAARELAADGCPAEAVAAHLLPTAPLRDPWVVDRLREAARDALVKGAPHAAVAYLERAIAEPPKTHLRAPVLFDLGDAETQLGRTPLPDRLTEALRIATEPGLRARISLRLAQGLPHLSAAGPGPVDGPGAPSRAARPYHGHHRHHHR